MKNLMKMAALAAVLMFSANVNAQDEFGPQKGDFGTEIMFNPFSNNFQTFKIDGLNFRYFLSDQHALRLNLNVALDNANHGMSASEPLRTSYPAGAAGDAAYKYDLEGYAHAKDYKNKVNNTEFGVSLGYEYHFAKFGRADIYAGAQVGIAMNSWKQTIDSPTPYDTQADGSSKWITLKNEYKGAADTNNDGTLDSYSSFAFGAGVFTGLDFYITKGLYVGAELGINFASGKAKNFDATTQTLNASYAVETTTVKTEVHESTTTLKFEVAPALRLGWKF